MRFWVNHKKQEKRPDLFLNLTLSQNSGSCGIRTHAIEMTGALNQRLRPLGHATKLVYILFAF